MQITKSWEDSYMALAVTFLIIVVVCAVVYFLMELVDKKKK